MAVTALIIVLATAGTAAWLATALHRALIGHRSRLARLIIAVAGLGYGLQPALHGQRLGLALTAVGCVAALSLLAPWLPRSLPRRRTGRPPEARGDRRGSSAVPLTDYEQADRHRHDLAAYGRELDEAWARGDMAAVVGLAGEIRNVARVLHDAAAVVFTERARVTHGGT